MASKNEYSSYRKRSPKQITGLRLAAYFRLIRAMISLLEDRHEPDPKGGYRDQTPLLYAVKNCHEAVMKFLLKNDAKLESKNRHSQTPLTRAIVRGRKDAVKLLLQRGAKVESQDNLDRTPLTWAAARDGKDMVKLPLAGNKIDPDQGDNSGLTPIYFAAKQGYSDVVMLFVEKCRENDGDIRDEDINISIPPAAGNRSSVFCEVCLSSILDLDTHYHCRTCDDGDFDICHEYIVSGYLCLDHSHKLVKRMVKDGTFVENVN